MTNQCAPIRAHYGMDVLVLLRSPVVDTDSEATYLPNEVESGSLADGRLLTTFISKELKTYFQGGMKRCIRC